jgi:hypothetical protein
LQGRTDLYTGLIGWLAVGAKLCAVIGRPLLAHAPLAPLKRLLRAFLITVVIRRATPTPAKQT